MGAQVLTHLGAQGKRLRGRRLVCVTAVLHDNRVYTVLVRSNPERARGAIAIKGQLGKWGGVGGGLKGNRARRCREIGTARTHPHREDPHLPNGKRRGVGHLDAQDARILDYGLPHEVTSRVKRTRDRGSTGEYGAD
jgi:hypothetical protein